MPLLSEPHTFRRIAVCGLGLLGGSLALAARGRGLAGEVLAIGRRPDDLEQARGEGVVDAVSTSLEDVAGCDFVVLCQPVEIIERDLPEVLRLVPDGALVTDVGSTKARIVSRAASVSGARGVFIGSHPMAGSEKTGWRNAAEALFEDATTIVTPAGPEHLREAVRVGAFWKALGSRLIFASPERHDRLVGLLSHTPHMVAVALMEEIRRSAEDPGVLRLVAGRGLRDTTRVAAGSSELWEQICHQNRDAVLDTLTGVRDRLDEIIAAVRGEDGCPELRSLLEDAGKARRSLD